MWNKYFYTIHGLSSYVFFYSLADFIYAILSRVIKSTRNEYSA